MLWAEPEADYIQRLYFIPAMLIGLFGAFAAGHGIGTAIAVSGNAKMQVKMLLSSGSTIVLHIIYDHTDIIGIPLDIPLVSFNGILYRTRNLLLFFIKKLQLMFHKLPIMRQ